MATSPTLCLSGTSVGKCNIQHSYSCGPLAGGGYGVSVNLVFD